MHGDQQEIKWDQGEGQMTEEYVFNIEFKDVLAVLIKRFYIILLITISTTSLGFYYGSRTVSVIYEVKSSLKINNKQVADGPKKISDDVNRIQQYMNTYSAIAETIGVSRKTLQNLKWNMSPEVISTNVIAIPKSQTPFIDLKFRWTDPGEAVEILNAFTEVYIQEANNICTSFNISVLEKTSTPYKLIYSNKRLYEVGGFFGGFILSVLLVFALHTMDDTLKTEKEVEKLLQLRVLGNIPKDKKKNKVINFDTVSKLKHPIKEAYKTLRTNLKHACIDARTIAVTSGEAGEGTTITAVMLAVAMAQDNIKTVLVDCNLRKPQLKRLFNLNEVGLSNYLIGEISWKDVLQKSEIEHLSILTAGFSPPNPSELLSLGRMKELIETLENEFDIVILDTPPVGMVTDAQVLSGNIGGYLLVVSSSETKREAAVKTKKLIEYADGLVLGVSLNKTIGSVIHKKYKHHYK